MNQITMFTNFTQDGGLYWLLLHFLMYPMQWYDIVLIGTNLFYQYKSLSDYILFYLSEN